MLRACGVTLRPRSTPRSFPLTLRGASSLRVRSVRVCPSLSISLFSPSYLLTYRICAPSRSIHSAGNHPRCFLSSLSFSRSFFSASSSLSLCTFVYFSFSLSLMCLLLYKIFSAFPSNSANSLHTLDSLLMPSRVKLCEENLISHL